MLSPYELEQYGIKDTVSIIHNPSYDVLFAAETQADLQGFEKGVVTESGAVNVMTGQFTGRSPKDKYIVLDDVTRETIWWNSDSAPNDNKPISPDIWQQLKVVATAQLSESTLYVVDTFCGAHPDHRMKVRFVTQVAWQAHFVKNMFIRPTEAELESYGNPDFVVLNASKTTNPNWQEQGLNSEVFTAFNLTEKMQIIAGTWYGGEMKKGLFAMMNYYLPRKQVPSMHCSANVGKDGDVAIFFGLSGTGKTTLSTDPKRRLIGDDEHGWDDNGIFNFEGGCYAKTIDLDPNNEPDIHRAIRRDALLENVTVNNDGSVDYTDKSVTENTRVSYPIEHIDNIILPSRAGHAKKVIFLTADAFGVLPPVSVLTHDQTKYHFLSGFTAKLAGTERGITEPAPTFSACFGKAFLTLHPIVYANELVARMDAAGATAYLVNTGWNGSGKRISIKATRAIIDSILNGSIDKTPTHTLPIFNLHVPEHVEGVDDGVLDPRDTYTNKGEWEEKATHLASLFVDNFVQYTSMPDAEALIAAGPKLKALMEA